MSALSGLSYGVGFGTAYGTIVEGLRTATIWAKWKALGYKFGYPVMADLMQKLLDAEKSEVHGLSSKGMIDTIWGFIDKTLDFSMILNESIATQLFVQMIQQSIAYAIHSSHAGSIGTVCNVYSGSSPLSLAETQSIGMFADHTDRHLKAFLNAELGSNIPTLSHGLMRGANTRLEETYRAILRDVDSLLSEWNDLTLSYYRHYRSMARTRLGDSIQMKETITERAYSLLEQGGNEHLARISEQLDTLEGAKAWWDATLIETDELKDIAIRVELERGASENNYNELKTDIIGAISSGITTWDAKVSQALGDMTDNETQYSLLIKKIFSTLFSNVSTFAQSIVDIIDTGIEDVCAYRNVTKAVEIGLVTELGIEEPFLEEETEHLYWKGWEQVDPIDVAYHYQSPRGRAWENTE